MAAQTNSLSCFYQSKERPLLRTALALALKLNQKGVHNEVMVFQESFKAMTLKGLDIHCVSQESFWKNVKAVRARIRAQGAKIVHAHAREMFFVCLWAAKQEGCKFIYSAYTSAGAALAKFWLKQADHVVASTQSDVQSWTQQKGLSEKRVSFIPVGLDLDHVDYQASVKTREDVRAELHLGAGRFVIGNIGPLIKEEDQLTLLKAFRKLLKKNMDAELCLLGRGPMRAELEAFAKEYDFEDRFKIIEQWDNIYTFQKAMDAMIYTTFGYDRSDALLLASALSKPVIATKIGHHEDVVVENKTGNLVPCGFPERIDSAVMRLKAIETLADEVGAEGRAFVENQFSLESVSARLIEMYQNILNTDKVAV